MWKSPFERYWPASVRQGLCNKRLRDEALRKTFLRREQIRQIVLKAKDGRLTDEQRAQIHLILRGPKLRLFDLQPIVEEAAKSGRYTAEQLEALRHILGISAEESALLKKLICQIVLEAKDGRLTDEQRGPIQSMLQRGKLRFFDLEQIVLNAGKSGSFTAKQIVLDAGKSGRYTAEQLESLQETLRVSAAESAQQMKLIGQIVLKAKDGRLTDEQVAVIQSILREGELRFFDLRQIVQDAAKSGKYAAEQIAQEARKIGTFTAEETEALRQNLLGASRKATAQQTELVRQTKATSTKDGKVRQNPKRGDKGGPPASSR